jgi:hypothetical protein
MNRLQKCGLRDAADAYKELLRQQMHRHKETGLRVTKRDINEAADEEMWVLYRPIVERLETPVQHTLRGLPDNLDDVFDKEYKEADLGKQLRDGWLWAVMQWIRVVRDTEDGPVANLAAATEPPPNSFALTVLATYALADADRRRELLTKALNFAERSHEDHDEEQPDSAGFLDSIS